MGKGPTRRQGSGKAPEHVRAIKKANRDADPMVGHRRGGYHTDPTVYDRADDDTEERLAEFLEEQEETDESRPSGEGNDGDG